MATAEDEIKVSFGENGAEVVIEKMRRVSRSYDDVARKFANPLRVKMGASGGGTGTGGFGPDVGAFSTKEMEKATGMLSHFGVEYERVQKKMRTPLGGNFGSGLNVKDFQKGAKGIDDLFKTADKGKGSITDLAKSFTFLGAAIAGIAIRKTIDEVITLTDTLTNLQNKIKVVTEGNDQLVFTQHELFKISRDTRTGMESVTTAYTRTARSVKELGKSQEDTLRFTSTLSKAVAVGGSTAVEASNAMIQLSQGLSSGTLRGDELRSVLEQLPIVAGLISKHLGVSVGQLRALGAAGKLTSEQVFDSIIAGTDEMNASFAKMTPTVAQSWEVFKNSALKASSALQPLMKDLSTTILHLADNFDTVINVGLSVANVLGVVLGVKAIGTLITGINALTVAMASNPIGAIAVGITAAVVAIAPFADKIGDTKDSIVTLKDVWTAFTDKIVNTAHDVGDALGGTFGIDSVFIVSLDVALGRLARFADMMHMVANPLETAHLAIASANGDKSATDALHANQIGMRDFRARAKGAAADRHAAKFKTEFEDVNSRFNAFMADRMPGAHPKTQKPVPGKAPGGKSFDDLMRELEDGLNVLGVGQLQINANASTAEDFMAGRGNATQNATNMRQGRGQMLAGADDAAIAKQLESTIDQLGKKQKPLTRSQIDEMREVISQQVGILQGRKDQLELEKSITEELEARLKVETDLIEAQNKMSVDIGMREQKMRADNANRMDVHHQQMSDRFDPNHQTKAEIQDLTQFRDDPKTIRSEAIAAQVEIDKLILSMEPLAVAFQGVADTMIQGFGDAIARSIVLNENLGSLLKNLAQVVAMQAISGLVSTGLGAAVGGLSSWGAGSKVTELPFRVPQFATGGYTGEQGGVVHPREYVLNAQATQQIGVGNLHAMNAGRAPAGGGAARIIINQNAPGVVVSAQETSRGEIQVMIEQGIAQGAGKAAAASLNEGNSPMSKAMRRNFDISRRAQ